MCVWKIGLAEMTGRQKKGKKRNGNAKTRTPQSDLKLVTKINDSSATIVIERTSRNQLII